MTLVSYFLLSMTPNYNSPASALLDVATLLERDLTVVTRPRSC